MGNSVELGVSGDFKGAFDYLKWTIVEKTCVFKFREAIMPLQTCCPHHI